MLELIGMHMLIHLEGPTLLDLQIYMCSDAMVANRIKAVNLFEVDLLHWLLELLSCPRQYCSHAAAGDGF